MQNSPSRRPWLIPGLVAATLFIGGVAANIIATDLEPRLRSYRIVVWIAFFIALIVAVVMAIIEARRTTHTPVRDTDPPRTNNVTASADGSVAIGGNVENSRITTGKSKASGGNVDGDVVGRDKIIHIQQTATGPVNALHQLRAPVGDFVGRDQEIETLIKTLRHGSQVSISGVNGMGGIGKTELALLVANRLATDYPNAQFFINLQGTDANPSAPQDVMATCIRAFLGPEARLPEHLDQLSPIYRSLLSGRRVLLLLDNAADDKQVLPLLPPLGCALLVTSRDAITLPGMDSLTLNPLTETEARELLLEITPRAAPAVQQICELCGYLPLAIRAAGSLLKITLDLDPLDYAAQLKDERKRLERIGTKGVELGVTASFNLSYTRLTEDAARVFRMLSVFPATFDATAEEAVCADPDHVQLSDLVRRSLLVYETSTKRYRLHDLARLFANERLSAEERAAGQKHHAIHYKDVLSVVNDLYLSGGEELARGLALFDLEWGNILAGHAWVVAQDRTVDEDVARLAIEYPHLGADVLYLRLDPRERIRWQEAALTSARILKNRTSEAYALGNLGNAYGDLRDSRRAIEFYEQVLPIIRELSDRRAEGLLLNNLGLAYTELRETERAIKIYEDRLVIARELRDRRGEGHTMNNLGMAYSYLGQNETAMKFYEQALLIHREIGDRRAESTTLGNLGVVYKTLGDTQHAIELYQQQLTIAREIGDRRGESITRLNMSLALYEVGQRAEAIQCAQQSLTILEQLEDPYASRMRAQLAAWRKQAEQ